jgi:hypothetical protein
MYRILPGKNAGGLFQFWDIACDVIQQTAIWNIGRQWNVGQHYRAHARRAGEGPKVLEGRYRIIVLADAVAQRPLPAT